MSSAHAQVVAVLLSAGQGSRMGAGQNKVFLRLAGEPLLAYATRAFVAAPDVATVLFVAHPAEVERVRQEIVEPYAASKSRGVIAGGATRHQSEARALAALRQDIEAGRVDVVMIHDAARPFVRVRDIHALVVAARAHQAALLAAPVGDDEALCRIAPDGSIVEALPPTELYRAQTPQAFDARLLLAAYDRAQTDGFEGTDTASSVERLGRAIHVIAGPAWNLKVTTPKDLLRAESFLRRAIAESDTDR